MDWLLKYAAAISLLVTLLNIAVTLMLVYVGYRLNKDLESFKSENAKKLEGLKSQLNAKFHAQSVRFKKEFDVYEQCWGIVIDLLASLEEFQPGGYSAVEGETYEQRGRRLAESLQKAKTDFAFAIHKNRPFFSPKVFRLFRKFQRFVNKEALIYSEQYSGRGNDEASFAKLRPSRLRRVVKALCRQSDAISMAIQERVGRYEKIEDAS